METWDIASLDVQPHQPEVLRSDPEARVIAINLPAGERLQEHQVHERAWLVVAAGEVEFERGRQTVAGGRGLVAHFDPKQPHEVRATSDARLVLCSRRGRATGIRASASIRRDGPHAQAKAPACRRPQRRRAARDGPDLHELQRVDGGEQAERDQARALLRLDRQGRRGSIHHWATTCDSGSATATGPVGAGLRIRGSFPTRSARDAR